MKVQLIGFDALINRIHKVELVKEIINSTDADLVLFPGHTLVDEDDVDYLWQEIENEKSTVVLEVKDSFPTGCLHLHNALLLWRDYGFEDMYTSQIFATADEIKGQELLMAKLFDELPRRQVECCGKRITVLHCGETALLASTKSDGYKAGFRFKDNLDLNARYEALLASTDIFLNPIHTPQGEQGVMAQRRATLSADGRYYFSTCSLPTEMYGKLKSKSIQYAWHDGQELSIKPEIHEDEYVSRTVEIP